MTARAGISLQSADDNGRHFISHVQPGMSAGGTQCCGLWSVCVCVFVFAALPLAKIVNPSTSFSILLIASLSFLDNSGAISVGDVLVAIESVTLKVI